MALNQFGLERPCCDLQCTRFEDDSNRDSGKIETEHKGN